MRQIGRIERVSTSATLKSRALTPWKTVFLKMDFKSLWINELNLSLERA